MWRPFPFYSGVCTVMVAPMETAVTPTDDLMKERVTMSNVLKKIWCSSALCNSFSKLVEWVQLVDLQLHEL